MPHLDIRLTSSAFGDSQIDVLSLDGEERLGQLFHFDVEVTTPDGSLDEEAVMTSPLTLSFVRNDAIERRVHGIAANIEERTTTGDQGYRSYYIRLVPRLWLGTVNEALDIFMDKSIPEVIEDKLGMWGFELGTDFVMRLRTDYPKREFVVQYRESDVAFISRWCEHLGITLSLEHDEQRDVVVFSDHQEAFAEIEGEAAVPFRDAGAGSGVSALVAKRRTMPRRIVMRDYNYRTPGVDLTVIEEVPTGRAGDVVEYGAHFKTPSEGKWFAGLRVQQVLSTQRVLNGQATEPRLRAGATFALEGHPAGELELLVTEVDHRAELAGPRGGRGSLSYGTTFRAIAKELTFRPPRITPRPKVTGVLNGVIDASAKGDYAEIDADGRYRVKFLYDTAQRDEGLASKLVRMAQPHAGGGYGMHFPLRPGVEVILTCVDGDPDRPVIASTVPNPSNPSPVTGGNNARNIIRTGGGNEINIDDTEGSHRIKMTTPHDETIFQLGAPNFNERGAALASRGNWTTAIEGVGTTIGKVGSAVEHFSSALSSDVVTGATPFKLSADWLLDSGEVLLNAADSLVDTHSKFEAAVIGDAENASKKAAHDARQASKGYENGKLRAELTADQRTLLAEYDAAEVDAEKKAAALEEAEEELEDARRRAEEVEAWKAERDGLPGGHPQRADLDAKIAEAEGAEDDLEIAEVSYAEAKELDEDAKSRLDEASEGGRCKGISREQWQELEGVRSNSLDHAAKARSASIEARVLRSEASSSDVAEAKSVLGIAKAGLSSFKHALDLVKGAKGLAKAVAPVLSTLAEQVAQAHKYGAIGQTAVRYSKGLKTAAEAVEKVAPRELSTPYHVLHSSHSTALLGIRQVVIGADNTTVHSDGTTVLAAGKHAALAGARVAEVSSGALTRVTAGSAVGTAAPELRLWSRQGSIHLTAHKSEPQLTGKPVDINLHAKNGIHFKSTDGGSELVVKEQIAVESTHGGYHLVACGDDDGDIRLESRAGHVVLKAADTGQWLSEEAMVHGRESAVFSSDSFGLRCDGSGVQLGAMESSADVQAAAVSGGAGLSVSKNDVVLDSGDSTLTLVDMFEVVTPKVRIESGGAMDFSADGKILMG
jgi:type VI secretion system secreted protein VgrG